MDLKRVQEELRRDILHHQALMEQLKKDPTDHALNLKLKDVQKHIAELGSKQKKILQESNNSNETNRSVPASLPMSTAGRYSQPALSPSNFLTHQFQAKVVKTGNAVVRTAARPIESHKSAESNSTYALIAIKNEPQPVPDCSNLVTSANNSNISINPPSHVVMSRPQSDAGKAFVAQSTLLVVSSPSQTSSGKQQIIGPNLTAKSVPIPMSLASLASNGGVVTLAGTWKSAQQQAVPATNTVEKVGRFMPTKQVQIKMPVVQSAGSKPLILMSQKNQPSHTKSLFRLLPKGHNITVNSTTPVAGGVSAHTVNPSSAINTNTGIAQQQFSTILMSGDANRPNQALQRVFVQRPDNKPTSLPTTSVTWQDLSSKTPSIHKPSYVPRKSYPNINNGVGSFQKFRILDGKAEAITKNQTPISTHSSSSLSVPQEKPRNAALKAVLTSPTMPAKAGVMTVARLVPLSVPKNGFFPIHQQDTTAVMKPAIKPMPSGARTSSSADSSSPFTPVIVTTASAVNYQPVKTTVRDMKTPDLSEEVKQKLSFLRNIDLIPREQAEKVRGRRFRKRRVAANPVYSGGMYVTNEIEPKRQCPDLLGAESITAPDVIVKRPRGRPRGSKNSKTLAVSLQSSARSNRCGSPANPANIQYVKQLKDILDTVASASKAVSVKNPIVKTETTSTSGFASSNATIPRPPSQSSFSGKTKNSSVSSERSESPEGSDEHEDQCAICGKTGEVLMCDTCSRVYHLSCATPPLTDVPQGMWVCSECKKQFKESKAKIVWPGVSAAVHAYAEFNNAREQEIEECQRKLMESRKAVVALQAQTKTLTSIVMVKVNNRMGSSKLQQSIHKELVDISTLTKSCWNLATHGATTSRQADSSN